MTKEDQDERRRGSACWWSRLSGSPTDERQGEGPERRRSVSCMAAARAGSFAGFQSDVTSAPRVSDTVRNRQRRRTFPAAFRAGEKVPLCCYGNTWVGCLPPPTLSLAGWQLSADTQSCEAMDKLRLVLNLLCRQQ